MSTLALKKSNSAPVAVEWLQGLMTRLQNYRAYRNTVNELSGLSDRELADLGLNRSIVKRVAFQATYDAN